jgi:hypothetical protein
MAGDDPPRREGEHRIGFVQRDQPLHIPRIRPLKKEFAEVLRVQRRRAAIRRDHGKYPFVRWQSVFIQSGGSPYLFKGAGHQPVTFGHHLSTVIRIQGDARGVAGEQAG